MEAATLFTDLANAKDPFPAVRVAGNQNSDSTVRSKPQT
jgi:hypothetical protein